jgi:hypothetical protein
MSTLKLSGQLETSKPSSYTFSMKSLRYLVVVFLLCFANSAAGQQTGTETPKAKLITVADLQKLRWIEGSWRGTGVNQPPFFERYRFENPTTLAVDGLEGDKVTDTTRFELKDGEFGGGNEGSRWVATAIDENSITFCAGRESAQLVSLGTRERRLMESGAQLAGRHGQARQRTRLQHGTLAPTW